jgi:tetraacyldisaccharide 4'-kinase
MNIRRIAAPLLIALSYIYRAITTMRNALYDRQILRSIRVSAPVISIGNLTAGGNAKTPLCIWLVRGLQARGFRPVVVSRGYGGSEEGPCVVAQGSAPDRFGDEPVLMSNLGIAVVVSRDRVAGALLALERKLGDCIVLDDGFQHRRIARDVDIISVNAATDEAAREFQVGNLLPYGLFREERDSALQRAHLIVLSSRSVIKLPEPRVHHFVASLPQALPIFTSSLVAEPPRRILHGATKISAELSRAEPIIALSGVANPEGFYDTLRALGYTIARTVAFGDHHAFTKQDLEPFSGMPLVCTEKDSVKIVSFATARDPWYTLPVAAAVDRAEEMLDYIVKRLERTNSYEYSAK